MKKNILILSILMGLFSGLISCFCKQDNPYWILEKFTIEFLDNQYNPIFLDTIEVDTLNLQITPTAIFIAQVTNSLNRLVVNSANAFQYPSPG